MSSSLAFAAVGLLAGLAGSFLRRRPAEEDEAPHGEDGHEGRDAAGAVAAGGAWAAGLIGGRGLTGSAVLPADLDGVLTEAVLLLAAVGAEIGRAHV